MSIAQAIKALDAANELFPYQPLGTRKRAKRRAYLTEAAARDFNDPQSAVNLLCGRAYIAGALTRWVLGDRVYGDHKQGRFLAILPPLLRISGKYE
jgi:hypothetical protein